MAKETPQRRIRPASHADIPAILAQMEAGRRVPAQYKTAPGMAPEQFVRDNQQKLFGELDDYLAGSMTR